VGEILLFNNFFQFVKQQYLRHTNFNALVHGTLVVGSTKLCGVEQRAPPIIGRAAITLGVGPHSSLLNFENCRAYRPILTMLS